MPRTFASGTVRRFWDKEPQWRERMMQCAARMIVAVRQGIPLEPRCAGEELVFWLLRLEDEVRLKSGSLMFINFVFLGMHSAETAAGFTDYSRPFMFWSEFGCLRQPAMKQFGNNYSILHV